jgi:cell division protein FtsB
MREDLQVQQDKVDRLQSEIAKLEAEIRGLKNDPRTVERRLREMGYARPDEVVVTFREPAH